MSDPENGLSNDQRMINMIKGKFLFSNSEHGNKRESYCELDCDTGWLNIFTLAKKPLLILPTILEVTRHEHDKEYLCLKYDEDCYIFLTITDQSDADEWEEALCEITGQRVPHPLRRSVTTRRKNRDRSHTMSSPSAPGFKLTVDIDISDDTSKGGEERDDDISPPSTREPQESHLGAVIGYDKVSPSPGSSPSNRQSYKDEGEAQTDVILDEAKRKLTTGHHDDPPIEEQPPTAIGDLHSWTQPSHTNSEPAKTIGELRSTEAVNQCTHMEIECSQEMLSVAVKKEDFLNTDNINDIFAFYNGSIYLKSCPERLQKELFIGTRIVHVNNQIPFSAEGAIENITTSAVDPVNLLVQLFPLGVRVRLRVSSFAALGIELLGNQITYMRRDGVMSKIADGLRGVCPALSTPTEEQRTITAIGNRHVPYDAMTCEVEALLDAAINSGNGHLVLQLHPSEFCNAMAPDALQRLLLEDGAVLNPTPARKLSLARSLKSNP